MMKSIVDSFFDASNTLSGVISKLIYGKKTIEEDPEGPEGP